MPADRALPQYRPAKPLLLATILAVAAMTALIPAHAQTRGPAEPFDFDVVSIKPNKSGTGIIRVNSPKDGYFASNIPLPLFISNSYGIKQDLIFGLPGWAASARYDIEAKVAGSYAEDQHRRIFQDLLASRFKLKAHIETRQLPLYELTLGKNGARLAVDATGIKGPDGLAHPGMLMMRTGQINGQAIPLSALVGILSDQLHHPVVDKTGLTGTYDIVLRWTPDQGEAAPPGGTGPGAATPPDTSGPSLFTAVEEQLGLRLVPAKGPVETLVIDHIEPPSEN
jgi:uncharacterized protein (TIGR03435 family)